MLDQLPEIATPNWLSQLSSETIMSSPFPLRELLRDSLYYPSSAFDGDPIRHLAGNFLSFIYVDYGVSQDRYTHALTNPMEGIATHPTNTTTQLAASTP